MKFRCLVITLACLAAFASDSWGQLQTTPEVQTKQKTDEAPNSQSKPDNQNRKIGSVLIATPTPSPDPSEQKTVAEKEKSSGEASEGTEYWVYHGYKVKITDGLLVLFTLGLVVIGVFQAIILRGTLAATGTAADAAKASADAAVALEIPRLVIGSSNLTWEWGTESCVMEYTIENGGKTAATLIEWSVELRAFAVLPQEPIYLAFWPSNRVLYPRSQNDKMGPLSYGLSSTDFEIIRPTLNPDDPIYANGPKIYFFGFFRFVDVFEITRITGFGYEINPVSGFTTRVPSSAYNYPRLEKQE